MLLQSDCHSGNSICKRCCALLQAMCIVRETISSVSLLWSCCFFRYCEAEKCWSLLQPSPDPMPLHAPERQREHLSFRQGPSKRFFETAEGLEQGERRCAPSLHTSGPAGCCCEGVSLHQELHCIWSMLLLVQCLPLSSCCVAEIRYLYRYRVRGDVCCIAGQAWSGAGQDRLKISGRPALQHLRFPLEPVFLTAAARATWQPVPDQQRGTGPESG